MNGELKATKKNVMVFGLGWAILLSFVALYRGIGESLIGLVALTASCTLTLVTIISYRVLTKPFFVWVKLSNFIGENISKIVLFFMFFFVFTPVALILKCLGKDLLRKKIMKTKRGYWVERTEQPQSMKNQY